MGPIKDDEEDTIVLKFKNNGNQFITMTESPLGIAINVNMTDASVGNYTVKIKMYTTNDKENSTSLYYFKISILNPNTPPRFVNDVSTLLSSRIV